MHLLIALILTAAPIHQTLKITCTVRRAVVKPVTQTTSTLTTVNY